MEPNDKNIDALKAPVVKTLDDNKAENIVEISLRGKSAISD